MTVLVEPAIGDAYGAGLGYASPLLADVGRWIDRQPGSATWARPWRGKVGPGAGWASGRP